MRCWLQHHFNSLNLYARLRNLGCPCSLALKIGGTVGAVLRPWIYRRAR